MEKGRRGESIVLNETFYIFCRLTASCRLPTANLMHGAKTLRRYSVKAGGLAGHASQAGFALRSFSDEVSCRSPPWIKLRRSLGQSTEATAVA